MSIRTVVTIILALIFGVSAAWGVQQFMSAPMQSLRKPELVKVYEAARSVPRGYLLAADVLVARDCAKDMVPPGVITKIEDAVNRVVLLPLEKGELLLDAKLAPKDTARGLATMIPSGMRAFTILSPHVASGVAGFILPGNRVDVLLTVAMGGGNDVSGGGSTMTLLQNLEILAVDQRLDAPSENKVDPNLRSVTLLVTPGQAAKLDLGQNKGMLHLSLRNPEDNLETDTGWTTLADLYRKEAPAIVEAPVIVEEVPVQVEETHQVVMDAAPKKSAPLEIRTLRGTQSDVIQLRQPSDTSDTP